MRKRNKKYKPKDTTLFMRKALAIFQPDSNNILSRDLIESFERRFRIVNQNLEQGTATKKHLMSIEGTYSVIQVLIQKDLFVEDMERYEIVLFIRDKIKGMMDRIDKNKQVFVGYKDDKELQAVTSLYNIAHDIFTNRGMTNKQYDLAVNILEKECALKNIKVY